MPLFNMTQLRILIPKGARLLGLDPGSRAIGLALTDVTLMLASPYGMIARGKLAANANEIARIARHEGVAGLVVGLPLSLDGSAGPAAQAARDWTHALSDSTGLPAALADERLSSSAVNRFLIGEADMTRKRRSSAYTPRWR
jgi:putative Holliday junction resolvase